ncbi:hypothetical protein NL64_16805 [Pseudomonas fluorescens]|jgi:hypothetical protein|uniref:peptidase inhibitor family I36 protein n=1 Tax=Pseudomonas fluorescens TaxID=294 RepID=UPI00054B28ED|nr:peptidase inhibitor family I36 protein [Pseudomonas fluorescens]KII31396.1 hypothetical protein NL64_16805 [Pseudomonas fluorescens]
MKIKWLTIVSVLGACIVAGFYLYSSENSIRPGKYVVFNPPLDDVQKAVVQQQMDQQLAKKKGGTKVSSTQLVYDNGAVVVTFPAPGVASDVLTSCEFGYFCVWEHPDYVGRKVSVVSSSNSIVNLSDYNMSHQVSSWKYSYKPYAKIVYGVDGVDGRGRIMTSTLKEIGIGDECCPFNIPEKTEAWTEQYFIAHLGEFGDRIVSIKVAPLAEDKK